MTIKLKLTQEQYATLVRMVYLGNWMVNSSRMEEERVKKYDDVDQHVLSFASAAKAGNLVEYDNESKKYFPAFELEMEDEAEQYRRDFEDDVFWEELTQQLARRDLIRQYGEAAVKKMKFGELLEKENVFVEKYDDEFVENGIENLELKTANAR
ncbi:MAG: hypothetical protein PHP45_06660 [Elusimicrobiales bacterium]|nr:hypothetical protein [Elusimicrobiales bacterium]